MKQKFKHILPAILAAGMMAGCAAAEPSSSPSARPEKEGKHMTAATQNPQSLWELFGNPDDWEMHTYVFPRAILTARAIMPDDLRARESYVHYQHITDSQAVATAINALKNAEVIDTSTAPEGVYKLRESRALADFKHKKRDETISFACRSISGIFYVERWIDGKKEELPPLDMDGVKVFNLSKDWYLKYGRPKSS